MASKHIADAEGAFMVINVTPDFCKVDNKPVPFDIFQVLPPEKYGYSPSVIGRGEKTLKLDSAVGGTIGNLGEGIISTVSGAEGHAIMIEGKDTVLVNGQPLVHDQHQVLMNVKV